MLIVDKSFAVKLYTRYRTFLDGDVYYKVLPFLESSLTRQRELKAYGVLSEASPTLAKKFPIIGVQSVNSLLTL